MNGRSRMRRRTALKALGALGATVAVGGGASASWAAGRVYVNRGGLDDATTLDPHKVGFPAETTITSDLFTGLTTLDPLAKAVAGCAESWTVSPDRRTYTFRLRNGLKWSDGTPLRAADFEWSLRRALDPATAYPYAGRLYCLKNARAVSQGKLPPTALGVRAADPRTVVVDLQLPAPYVLEVLASFGMPAPRHAIEKLGADWIRPDRLVTNGAFTVAEWRPNAFIRLRRNPNFHDVASVRAEEVTHFPMAQPITALRRFAAGELDFLISVPHDQLDYARREFGDQLRVGQGLGVEVLVFNTERGPTADPRVRRALSMVLDREALAKNVLGDVRLAAYSYVAPGSSNYPVPVRADFAAWPQAQRVAEARRLLAAAGYGPGKPLRPRLTFPGNDSNRRVAVVLDAMWRAAGVTAELQAKEQRALSADVARGDFDCARIQWLAGHTDAMVFLERLDGAAAGTTMNQSRYRNPRYDSLLQQADAEPDLTRRAEVLRRAETMALADQPVAPLFYFVARRLVSTRLQGWVSNPRGIHLSRYMFMPPR